MIMITKGTLWLEVKSNYFSHLIGLQEMLFSVVQKIVTKVFDVLLLAKLYDNRHYPNYI